MQYKIILYRTKSKRIKMITTFLHDEQTLLSNGLWIPCILFSIFFFLLTKSQSDKHMYRAQMFKKQCYISNGNTVYCTRPSKQQHHMTIYAIQKCKRTIKRVFGLEVFRNWCVCVWVPISWSTACLFLRLIDPANVDPSFAHFFFFVEMLTSSKWTVQIK